MNTKFSGNGTGLARVPCGARGTFGTSAGENCRGVSLVELLVVIAIVLFLVGLLFPAFKAVRESANLAKCASNLRQIVHATHLYAKDHDGYAPDVASFGLHPEYGFCAPTNKIQLDRREFISYFSSAIADRAGIMLPVFYCPRGGKYGTVGPYYRNSSGKCYPNTSYAINDNVSHNFGVDPLTGYDASGQSSGKYYTTGLKLMDYDYPAQTVLWTESSSTHMRNPALYADYAGQQAAQGRHRVIRKESFKKYAIDRFDPGVPHEVFLYFGKLNVAFIDQHIEVREWSPWSTSDDPTTKADPFYPPPPPNLNFAIPAGKMPPITSRLYNQAPDRAYVFWYGLRTSRNQNLSPTIFEDGTITP